MKKVCLLIAFILVVSFTLGCAPEDNGIAPTPTPPPEELALEEKYKEKEINYTPIMATNEDSKLSLWFNHAYTKTPSSNISSTNRATYSMYMAKNEIEGFAFYLSSMDGNKTALTADITTFRNSDGEEISTEIFKQVYFDLEIKEGKETRSINQPDALPPLVNPTNPSGKFDLMDGKSQGFLVKAKTLTNSKAGKYEATLQIKNQQGEQIKVSKVFLTVWDFALSDETACDTAMDLSRYEISRLNNGKDLYEQYYDYLLENRIAAYDMPYEVGDARAEKYLSNPRVTSYNITGWKKGIGYYTEKQLINKIQEKYDYLKGNPEWLKKGYFYFVDEPSTEQMLDDINKYGSLLKENFPNYRMMAPFFINKKVNSNTDYIEYIKDSVNLWVPKTFGVTSVVDAISNGVTSTIMEGEWEQKFGTFPKRMQSYVDKGHELWWYICWEPTAPYSTLNTEDIGLSPRTLFWQQKINNVTGFLYFMVNEWTGDSWNSHGKANPNNEIIYGDGQLIYNGGKYNMDTPIGSLRLEAVRDGIEDYEYLTMLEKKVSKEHSNDFARKVATHVAAWEKDDDKFAATRIILGNYLNDILRKAE